MDKLPDITLCAVDGVGWKVTERALKISRSGCEFADTICFSLEKPTSEVEFRTVLVEELKQIANYTPFLMKRLNEYIKTSFALVTQWDGYVIHPKAWNPDFLNYDYIGAKWHWHPENKVGNGGFSLRSKRLLEALQDERFKTFCVLNGARVGEDDLICRVYRRTLENEYGIRFAPEQIADQFSYECSTAPTPTFGFHGMMNLRKEVSREDLHWMALHLPQCVTSNPQWGEILKSLAYTAF